MSEEVGLVSTEEATDVEPQDKSNEKLLKLPFSKIRTIMKLDPDFNGASVEAVFLIAKATVRISTGIFRPLKRIPKLVGKGSIN